MPPIKLTVAETGGGIFYGDFIMDYSDFGTDIFVSENCNTCGRVVIRVPHELFVDMLKNCPKSYNRDVLIRKLMAMPKSLNLEAAIDREKIFDMLDE